MALQDIRELTKTAEVGRFYLVPCIKVKEYPQYHPGYSLTYRGLWMPVVGNIHEDPELKKSLGAHIHPDWRFVPSVVVKRLDPLERGRFAPVVIANQDIESSTLVLRRRKMLREFTFPSNVVGILEPIYVGKQSGCATCPHRGVSLAGLKPDEEGNVICPGHGLKANQQTGLVVKR